MEGKGVPLIKSFIALFLPRIYFVFNVLWLPSFPSCKNYVTTTLNKVLSTWEEPLNRLPKISNKFHLIPRFPHILGVHKLELYLKNMYVQGVCKLAQNLHGATFFVNFRVKMLFRTFS